MCHPLTIVHLFLLTLGRKTGQQYWEEGTTNKYCTNIFRQRLAPQKSPRPRSSPYPAKVEA